MCILHTHTHTWAIHVFTPCMESPHSCTKPQRHTQWFPVSSLSPHTLHTLLDSQPICPCNKTIKGYLLHPHALGSPHMHWALPTIGLTYIVSCLTVHVIELQLANFKLSHIHTHAQFSPHLACQFSTVYKQYCATKAQFLVVSDTCRQMLTKLSVPISKTCNDIYFGIYCNFILSDIDTSFDIVINFIHEAASCHQPHP